MARKAALFYAVRRGRNPGIYRTWEECKYQTNGYRGSEFKGFPTLGDAEAFMSQATRVRAGYFEEVAIRRNMRSVIAGSGTAATEGLQAVEDSRMIASASSAGPTLLSLAEPRVNSEKSVGAMTMCPTWKEHAEARLDLLNPEQRRVVDAVLCGRNVFFTGSPGTGKSSLLESLVQTLRSRCAFPDTSVVVCASTGVAAVHVGGSTLHAFLACGQGACPEDWQRVLKDRRAKRRIQSASVLLVDEVSMFSAAFIDAASEALCSLRGDGRPFGGLQVVFCGDFLQLPPVDAAGGLAFESAAWDLLKFRTFVLRQNHRQDQDHSFQRLLGKLRLGEIPADLRSTSSSALDASATWLPPDVAGEESEAILRLVCTNAEADGENKQQLEQLPGEAHTFTAVDTGDDLKDPAIRRALGDLVVPAELTLKVGARVMLLKNLRLPNQCKVLPNGKSQLPLVNGSVGTVVGFEDGGAMSPIVEFSGGYRRRIVEAEFSGHVGEVGTWCRRQVPLRLAWAMTVHKSQGLTLERGAVDLHRAFEPAQVYVAISRFKKFEQVEVLSLPSQARMQVGPMRLRAIRFHNSLERITDVGAGGGA